MEFCILPPLDQLNYGRLSTRHLCLAHVNDVKYWEFYRARQREGDIIILDNGAYEGSHDWDVLRNRIAYLDPDVAILPDRIGESWDVTYREAFKFLDEHFKQFALTDWMYVPQALEHDIVGWSIGLNLALEDVRISWVGLPRALAYLYTNDPFIRSKIATHIKRMRPDVRIHALGMVNGSIRELQSLAETGCVESIDSHWPFKGTYEEILPRLEVCGVNTTTNFGTRSYAQR
jgi:hypothetical protein